MKGSDPTLSLILAIILIGMLAGRLVLPIPQVVQHVANVAIPIAALALILRLFGVF